MLSKLKQGQNPHLKVISILRLDGGKCSENQIIEILETLIK